MRGVILVFHEFRKNTPATAPCRKPAEVQLATEAAELGVFVVEYPGQHCHMGERRIYKTFGRTRRMGPSNAAQFGTEVVHPDDAAQFPKASR